MIDVEKLEVFKKELLSKFETTNPDAVKKVMACQVVVNNRMKTRAGVARIDTNQIILNGRLLGENSHYVTQTFAHELAHLLSCAIHGYENGKGHGSNWENIMAVFGFPAKRTHPLKATWFYKGQASCKCKTYNLKARMYNKMKRGANFLCRKCKSRLVILDNVG